VGTQGRANKAAGDANQEGKHDVGEHGGVLALDKEVKLVAGVLTRRRRHTGAAGAGEWAKMTTCTHIIISEGALNNWSLQWTNEPGSADVPQLAEG